MENTIIPIDQYCDSGCGHLAQFFSTNTGRYRCTKSASSCPANKAKNSSALKQAHKDGKLPKFTDDMRLKSQVRFRRNLVKEHAFEDLGHTLRKKIVIEDQEYKCAHCELEEWMGLRITLELDHIDGNRYNNVRNNLRCLCPNCHSITDTWKMGQHKGKKSRKCSDDEIIAAFNKTGSINAALKALNMNWGSVSTVKKVLFKYGIINEI